MKERHGSCAARPRAESRGTLLQYPPGTGLPTGTVRERRKLLEGRHHACSLLQEVNRPARDTILRDKAFSSIVATSLHMARLFLRVLCVSRNKVGLTASRRVQDRLQTLFKERGRGTKARVERDLGLYDGFFDNRRGRGDLGVGILIAALQHLEVDVGAFLARALGEAGDIPGDSDPPPRVRSPAAVTIARRYGITIGESRRR